MAGRRPKPTRIKKLAGNPGKRKLNDREPVPVGVAACPSHLDAAARREWKRVAPALAEMGVLSSVDQAALAAYCANYSLWVQAAKRLKKSKALTVQTGNGGSIANPLIRIQAQALDQMRKFMIEFGMTPAARSRIVGANTDPHEDNPFAALASENLHVQ